MIQRFIFSFVLVGMVLASVPTVSFAACPPAGCGQGKVCNQTTQVCETAPPANQTPAQQQGQTQPTDTAQPEDTGPNQQDGLQFIPLTSIPGVAQGGQAPNLPAFLNDLYKICIGAAAVLAVLKIIQGGITYMLGDSVTEKREAKHHIALAVFGLVLVLAPALVFGIIDPRILTLNISTAGLETAPIETYDPAVAAACGDLGKTENSVVQPDFKQCCEVHGLHAWPQAHSSAFTCRAADPNAAQEAGPGGSPGSYFIRIPTVGGQYGTARLNNTAGQTCIQAAYESFTEQSACTAATAADEAARASWITMVNCHQESGQMRLISGANIPFCPDVQTLQH